MLLRVLYSFLHLCSTDLGILMMMSIEMSSFTHTSKRFSLVIHLHNSDILPEHFDCAHANKHAHCDHVMGEPEMVDQLRDSGHTSETAAVRGIV